MNDATFPDIGSAVLDDSFPDVDLALRRGRHIDREDGLWYSFLLDAQAVLEAFYRRFGCELVHKSDGYFYLLPTGDRLGRRQLSATEMLVGQALALLYLDPRTVQSGGHVTRDDVLGHLASVMGTDGLMQAFNPKKRRLDERVAQETVRSRVAEGLRKLAQGGFIDLTAGDEIRLRSALMRFAEPVRGSDSPAAALEKLVARGEVVLTEPSPDDEQLDSEPSTTHTEPEDTLEDASAVLDDDEPVLGAMPGAPSESPSVLDESDDDFFSDASELAPLSTSGELPVEHAANQPGSGDFDIIDSNLKTETEQAVPSNTDEAPPGDVAATPPDAPPLSPAPERKK